jgi:alpha-glucosidase
VLVQKVYLPQGEWYSLSDGTRFTGGRSYLIRASLGQVPLFLRGGGVLPMGPVRQYSSEPNAEPLTLVVAPGTGSSLLYEDKGEGYDYREGKYRRSMFTVTQAKGRLHISREREGRFQPEYAKIRIQVLGIGKEVLVDQDFTEVLI